MGCGCTEWIAIGDINLEIANIYAEIAAINAQIAAINSEIATLQADISALQAAVASLEARVSELEADLAAMNHGTISIRLREDTMELDVWGEAPLGSADATVKIYKASDPGPSGTPVYTDTDSIMYDGANDSRYAFNDWTGDAVNLSGFDPEIYDVEVEFGGMPGSYKVSAVFSELLLLHLEEKVEKLDDGTIEFAYESGMDQLIVQGEAPTSTQCMKLFLVSSSFTLLEQKSPSVSQKEGLPDYTASFDTAGLPQEALNVFAAFYSDPSCSFSSREAVTYDVSEALLSEDLFGFRDITVSSYVTSYYVNDIKVPITFALKPDIKGLYEIEYKTNGGNWKKLKNCSWYDEGVKTYKKGNIKLNSTGVKRVKLRATHCSAWFVEGYKSYTFRIRHVDLKDTLTAATTIVSPTENSDTTYPYPVGSIADSVYWTQSGAVPLVSYFTTNTEPANPRCGVFYDDSLGVERIIGNYSKTAVGPQAWDCNAGAQGFSTAEWNNTNHTSGNYTTIRVSERVVSQADSTDEVKVGIDNTAPAINSIDPDLDGIMNGTYTGYADINDDLSGIDQVDFYLIEKDGYTYCEEISPITVDGNLSEWDPAWKQFTDANAYDHESGQTIAHSYDLYAAVYKGRLYVAIDYTDDTTDEPHNPDFGMVFFESDGDNSFDGGFDWDQVSNTPIWQHEGGSKVPIASVNGEMVRSWNGSNRTYEYSIPLSVLGASAGDSIKIGAYILDGVHTGHHRIRNSMPNKEDFSWGDTSNWTPYTANAVSGLLNCWTGSGNIVWSQVDVDFNAGIMKFYYDLNTLEHPDGDYNVGFGARDIAGNYSYKEVDPMIDNTKPEINSVSFSPSDPKFRGETITIEADVSDNLSGVDSVWATITRPDATVDIVELKGTEPSFTGEYKTGAGFATGTYNVVVDANDHATNNADSKNAGFDLHYRYLLDITLSDNSVETGDSVTVSGSVVKDDNSAVQDANVDIVFRGSKQTVKTDANGNLTAKVSSSAAGTFAVDANIVAPNGINFTDAEAVTFNSPPTKNPPAAPSTGGGPSSGGSGSASLEINLSSTCVSQPIEVTVLNKDGNPAPDATVSVVKDRKNLESKVTPFTGKVSFTLEEEGEYLFRATKSGYALTVKRVELSECEEEGEEEETEAGEEEGEETGTGEEGTGTGEEEETETGDLKEAPAPPTTPTGLFALGNQASNAVLAFLIVLLAGTLFAWVKPRIK